MRITAIIAASLLTLACAAKDDPSAAAVVPAGAPASAPAAASDIPANADFTGNVTTGTTTTAFGGFGDFYVGHLPIGGKDHPTFILHLRTIPGHSISFTANGRPAAGTYDFATAHDSLGFMLQYHAPGESDSYISSVPHTGTLKVTAADDAHVAGTFDVQAAKYDMSTNTVGAQVHVTVTFDVKCKPDENWASQGGRVACN